MTEAEWQAAGTKPLACGVYEVRRQPGFTVYQHWNGQFWGKYMPTPERALEVRKDRSVEQSPEWRQFGEKPLVSPPNYYLPSSDTSPSLGGPRITPQTDYTPGKAAEWLKSQQAAMQAQEAPLFEIGKIYRQNNGELRLLARPKLGWPADDRYAFEARFLDGRGDGVRARNGVYVNKEHDSTLQPGAIPEEVALATGGMCAEVLQAHIKRSPKSTTEPKRPPLTWNTATPFDPFKGFKTAYFTHEAEPAHRGNPFPTDLEPIERWVSPRFQADWEGKK